MNDRAPAQGSGNAGAPLGQVRVLGQFIKDLSFENFLLQRGERTHRPAEFQVNVNLDGRALKDGVHEALIRLQLSSKEKETGASIYYVELEYSGLFHFQGVPGPRVHPLLMVECPQVLFPFLRRIVHDVTRDGGFAPFNLEMIDFARMYQSALEQRAKTPGKDGAD